MGCNSNSTVKKQPGRREDNHLVLQLTAVVHENAKHDDALDDNLAVSCTVEHKRCGAESLLLIIHPSEMKMSVLQIEAQMFTAPIQFRCLSAGEHDSVIQ